MLERVVFAAAVAVVLVMVYLWVKRRQLGRVAQQTSADPLLHGTPAGVPTIVYFTTPNCAPCRYQQKPALQQLKAELGDGVYIIEVDAAEQPDDAKRWGVFTAPTTFVLNGHGAPHTVNHGVADARKLAQQIRAAQNAIPAESPAARAA
jgi:thioredoxin 1